MKGLIILEGITIEDLKVIIAEAIDVALEKRLNSITNCQFESKQILSRKEVSAMLGGVSTPTFIEWSKTGYLKSFNMGRKVRYRLADVQAFIDNRTKS